MKRNIILGIIFIVASTVVFTPLYKIVIFVCGVLLFTIGLVRTIQRLGYTDDDD